MNHLRDRVLPLSEVIETIGIGKTTYFRMRQRGETPAEIRISPRRIGVRRSELESWLKQRQVPTKPQTPNDPS